MSTPQPPFAPGTYKFTVKSAEHAVALIREKLGTHARVLSVRPIAPTGFRKFFTAPQLEVIAEIDAPRAAPTVDRLSSEPALPDERAGEAPAPRLPSPVSRPRRAPAAESDLSGLLRRSGITETALSRLQMEATWPELNRLPLHRALAETSRLLRQHVDTGLKRPPISRAAFIGTPGVGRTTALCKWLALEVFRRARLGHVVSVEFDRPHPLGPLPVFAEALGVPLAHFPCATEPATTGGFVYFDLPGISTRRPAENAPTAAWLDREKITERVLVLNAAYDRPSLRDTYAAGRDLGATHLVFTHLDEVPQWGKLWDYLFDETVEPLFLATGPSLTGDCEDDVAGAIVRHTLPNN